MRVQLTYVLEAEADSIPAIQGSVTRKVNELATVIAVSNAPIDEEFTVFGAIKGDPNGPGYRETVRAQSADEAKAQVLGADDTRTVVAVVSGSVQREAMASDVEEPIVQ